MRALLPFALALLAPMAAAEIRALVVAGLGGEARYEAEFQRHANQGAEALRKVSPDVTLMLGESASAEALRGEIEALAERSAGDDTVFVMLIGHGSYDQRDYRFNLPGPDATGSELAAWLDELSAGRQVVVVATSASGALQPALETPGRTVITATKSGGEDNATVFSGYFTGALTNTAADTDKDGYVSAAEAFAFAEAGVDAHYQERNRMATEHPVRSGPVAGVVLAELAAAPTFAAGNAMDRDRLAALESEIEALRRDKGNRETNAYYGELQRLLLEIALLRRRLSAEGDP